MIKLKYIRYNKHKKIIGGTVIPDQNRRFKINALNLVAYIVLALELLFFLPNQGLNQIFLAPSTKLYQKINVKEIHISGNTTIPEDEIKRLIDSPDTTTAVESAYDIAQRIKTIPAVKEVIVDIKLPNQIYIIITEDSGAAIYKNKTGAFVLINNEGKQIRTELSEEEKNNSIILVGENADKEFKNIITQLKDTKYYNRIVSLYFIQNRRWNIFLDDGTIIKLPDTTKYMTNGENAFLQALKYAEKFCYIGIDEKTGEMRNVSVYDMRLYPNKIYVHYKNVR